MDNSVISMIQFEYVASGVSYTRLAKKNLTAIPATVQYINRCLGSLQNKANHKVSYLYNAYTEEGLGALMHKHVRPGVHNIYADSGGLQMVTLGAKVDAAAKRKVYEGQAKYADIAMSFDEIPLTIAGKTNIHDMESRLFDDDILEDKARLSGLNLKEQILFFQDRGVDTKAMMILHGNDHDTTQLWLDYLLDEVDEELYSQIAGVSFAGTSFGGGALQDFERAFILTDLKYPGDVNQKHLHMLGLGSLVRMLPLAALYWGGHFSDAYTISYDSTTHTAGLAKGNYFMENKNVRMLKTAGRNFDRIFNDINKNMDELGLVPIIKERLYRRLSHPPLWDQHYDKDTDSFKEFHVLYAYFTSQLYNFITAANRLFVDKEYFEYMAHDRKMYGPCMSFTNVTDRQDFNEWKNINKTSLKSKPVPRKERAAVSLEELFT